MSVWNICWMVSYLNLFCYHKFNFIKTGLTVGQVCAIFCLSEEFGSFTTCSPISSGLLPSSCQFLISRCTKSHDQHVDITGVHWSSQCPKLSAAFTWSHSSDSRWTLAGVLKMFLSAVKYFTLTHVFAIWISYCSTIWWNNILLLFLLRHCVLCSL